MMRRPLAAGLLLCATVAASASAQTTARYRVETSNETTVDLSSVGQPNQLATFTLVTWIAVALRDTAGGRSLTVTVDSMRFEGIVPGLSQLTADSARGATITALVDPESKLKQLVIRPENPLLTDLEGVLHGLFPRFKAGARSGETWTDSLEIFNTTSGANLVSNYLIHYEAGAGETLHGVPGTRVSSRVSANVKGTMENPMVGSMEVTGTIRGESSFVMDGSGRYLGGTGKSSSEQLLRIPMAPSPIPVQTARSVTVSYLP
jgi:hypothetical protein